MWFEEYNKLSEYEKEEFKRISNLLLSKTFIVKYKLDKKEKTRRSNPDYNFFERHFEIFKGYHDLSGWKFSKDSELGVVQIYNCFGKNHVKLDKNTTLILFTLRVIFDEEREKASLSKEVITSISNIIEKLKNIGALGNKRISDKDIQTSFALLKHYNIIDRIDGNWKEYNTRIMIYPSILFVISNEKVNEIYENFGDELNSTTQDTVLHDNRTEEGE